MKNTHTPGPWDIFPKDDTLEIGNYGAHAPLVRLSATVPTNDFEGWANARLIASAPDMFEALQAVCDAYGDRDTLLMAQCKAALSKAKGEA